MEDTAPPLSTVRETAASPRLKVDELRRFRTYLSEGERAELFRRYHEPRPLVALWQVAQSWALVFAGWAAVVYVSPLWLPLTLVLVGSRQRALGNTLHDAAHGNMFTGRKTNRGVATLLFGPCIFEDFEAYRLSHLRHHAYLGDPEGDPDFLPPPRDADTHVVRSPWRFYRHFLFNGTLWRKSLLGELPRLSGAQRLQVVLWWAVLLTVLGVLGGARAALSFAAVWMLARATVYHAIKVFAEISDHVGLEPGGIVGYTRNLPSNGLAFFLHPHHDNYHLTHHIFPRIPLANLAHIHRMLEPLPEYSAANHCHGYFLGPTAVVKSWTTPAFNAARPPDASAPARPDCVA